MTDSIKPVIMIGATRSGKSLIAQILEETGHYSALAEPITIWDIGRPRRCPDDARGSDEATPSISAAIRHELIKRIGQDGPGGFVDDLPHHSFRFGFCRAVLPEARFIMVSRDARAAIPCMRYGWTNRDSLSRVLKRRLGEGRHRSVRFSRVPGAAWRWGRNTLRVRLGHNKVCWGPTAPGQTAFAKTHSLLETIAFQWASMVRHALDGLGSIPADRVLRIRYEDIWSDREGVVQSLADFCSVPRKVMADSAEAMIVPSKRQGTLVPISDEEWRLIWPIIKPIQYRLEYPPPCTGLS